MAGPTLGTLLIQRLDAALGTTLSAQSSIVNRATPDAITQPGQPDRLEPVSNTLIRHPRETVDRLISGTGSDHRVQTHKPSTDRSGAADRTLYSSPTTSATTTLGPAARIILALFAHHTGASPPIAGRTPLFATPPAAGRIPLPATAPVAGRTSLPATAPSVGTHAGRSPAPAAPQSTTAGLTVQGGPIATGNTDQLAQALTRGLTQALQHSGLFYESHLKEVSRGQYRLADAQQEPQAKAALHARAGAAASSTGPVGASPTTASTSTAPTAPAPAEPTTTTPSVPGSQPATGPTTASSTMSHTATTPGVDPATHGIVRQQLEALADQTVHWRGEAWPGSDMDWQIRRQPEHEGTSAPEAEADASWQSRIRILLPGLGDVTADVRLLGKQIYLTFQTDDATAQLMRHHASELYRQMSDRQLDLTAIHFIDPEQPKS